MIIGNGQLAQAFKNLHIENSVIFASGVANSNCIEEKEFEREKELLISTLLQNKDKKSQEALHRMRLGLYFYKIKEDDSDKNEQKKGLTK